MKKISEVQIKAVKPKEGLVGFASLVLADCLYLSSIGVYQKKDGTGYRVTYPNKRVGNTFLDLFHPLNRELSKAIENAVNQKAQELFDV